MKASSIHYTLKEKIAFIQMDDGKANVFNSHFIASLRNGLQQAREDKAKAVLFFGRDKFFSAGLDLKTLPMLDDEELKVFMLDFRQIMKDIASFEKPTIAMVNGHCIAGGAVFLAAFDYRIGSEGNHKIGLNETAINIPLPRFIVEMARLVLNPSFFIPSILYGTLYSPQEAKESGFLQEVVSKEELEAKAWQMARQLSELPEFSFHYNKLLLRPLLHQQPQDEYQKEVEVFIKNLRGN